ncbi:ATP-binding response regulator [Leptolyngbya sp. NIES-2104]|uniref:ATP-binding response regulator n=1 Tax=Leptolyngbya sp. NIES-2104 TaxID=1552121 RepID=UPI0006EC9FCA|nr:response regulator [Leptolyngbya sp. NIES-2104]GAP94217.1 signal transduction histidine kinase [Leptolyngbya sp. NIES-2104]
MKGDILIVDDTLDNLRLLSAMLAEQGYEVRSVVNGSTALMGIQAQPPDLVLLDITMPGMDGYEVCQRLRENSETQEIPVIFISALNEAIDKIRAFAVGGADFITKPFQVEEVLVRVEHQLKLCRLNQQLQEQNRRLQTTEEDLRRALGQERALNQRIEEMAAVEERNRIARDIHDSLGHLLVALNVQLETGLTLWTVDLDRAYSFLTEAKQLGSQALQAVRQSVSNIRSDPLQGQLLESAIVKLTDEFYLTAGILPDCSIDLSHPLSKAVNHVAYRIVQESLTNICKYADATIVQIRLQTTSNGLSLVVKDNGKGFYPSEPSVGYGLRGMQERTAAVGGQLNIDSSPGNGCCICAELPNVEIGR